MTPDRTKDAEAVALSLAYMLSCYSGIVTRSNLFGHERQDPKNWRVLQHALHILTREGVVHRARHCEKSWCCGHCRDKRYQISEERRLRFISARAPDDGPEVKRVIMSRTRAARVQA